MSARVEASLVMNREADEETEFAIELTGLCKELHVLPGPGGLLEQDAYYVHLLKAGLRGINKKNEVETEKQKAQAKAKRH